MSIEDIRKTLTSNQVAKELGISVNTLNNWYKWYYDDTLEKPDDVPPLPAYDQETEHGRRYWSKSDLLWLQSFQLWIPRGRAGVMGAVSAKYWGKRGKRRLDNQV